MRIYMQNKPGPTEAPKYAQFLLQQDLLGGWTLIKEIGTPGGKAQIKRELYLDLLAAQDAIMQARDLQLKKGLMVTFAEGLHVQ